MQNNFLKELEQLFVALEMKKIELIRNQKYEEAFEIRQRTIELTNKLQRITDDYKILITKL